MISNCYFASDDIDKSLKHFDIKITYPSYWFSPVRLSPFSQTIEEETIRWMRQLNLINNISVEDHVRAMEPRHYAGYTHAMAAYDHALLYCQYITMWLLWDDDVIEKTNSVSNNVLLPLHALSGEHVDATDIYVAAFKHLGDEYEKLGASRAWRKRFADKMIEWAHFAVQEEIARRQNVNENKRSFEEALNLRSMTVGIRPNSVTLERAVGIEVPDYIHQDPDYELFLDQAAKICCIVNDLVGVPKDIKNNQVQSNLILYYQLYHESSLKDAFKALIEIHDQAVKTYDQLAKKILSKVEPGFSERLAAFFQQLRYMDSGFGYWHQDCVRYQSLTASDGIHYFKLKINNCVKDNGLLTAA